jgi:hypothetical protein
MTLAEKIAKMQGGTHSSKLLSKPMLVSSSPAPEKKKIEAVVDERSLSQVMGEGIDHTPTKATLTQEAWNQALNAFASEMCIVSDPKDPEMAWIGLRISGSEERPLLLYQLPYWEHPLTIRQSNQPF